MVGFQVGVWLGLKEKDPGFWPMRSRPSAHGAKARIKFASEQTGGSVRPDATGLDDGCAKGCMSGLTIRATEASTETGAKACAAFLPAFLVLQLAATVCPRLTRESRVRGFAFKRSHSNRVPVFSGGIHGVNSRLNRLFSGQCAKKICKIAVERLG
jgi:hypothetical protein